MRAVRFFVALVFATALQAAATRLFPTWPQWIDLLLVVTILTARHGHLEGGLFAGAAAGWAADALSGGPFGLFGFANAAVGYGAATAARNLVVARPGSIAALFAIGAAAHGALLLLLALLGLAGPALPSPVSLLVKVGSTALIGLAWVRVQESAGRRFRWRRNRSSGSFETPAGLR